MGSALVGVVLVAHHLLGGRVEAAYLVDLVGIRQVEVVG